MSVARYFLSAWSWILFAEGWKSLHQLPAQFPVILKLEHGVLLPS